VISYPGPERSHSFEVETLGWLGFRYDDGEKVPVLYLASDPDRGVRGTFVNLWLLPLILIPTGLLLVGSVWWRRQGAGDDDESDLTAEQLIAQSRGRRKRRPNR
jgi:hypothetical protein